MFSVVKRMQKAIIVDGLLLMIAAAGRAICPLAYG